MIAHRHVSRTRTIVLTGGGSGGHLTPVQSVAHALAGESPGYKLVYIGQKGDKVAKALHLDPVFAKTHSIYAGKLRRYHGEGMRQLLDFSTQFKNIRDVFLVVVGTVQAWVVLGKIKPAAVFCKGGFVCVPVGVAAALRGIPYVTHDSDSIPGLANRLIARWATVHAVALPAEIYPYPASKTVSVGVPIQSQFSFVTEAKMRDARKKLGIADNAKVLLVIGGGLGAQRVNQAVVSQVKRLFTQVGSLHILHVAGQAGEYEVGDSYDKTLSKEQRMRVHVYGFTTEVATLGAAANVVVTRAGATNLAEFAMQGKACIIVPNPLLTGEHQPKNAKVYAERSAAIVLPEQQLDTLTQEVALLLNDTAKQLELGNNITQFANKNAAISLAHVILAVAKKDK